MANTPNLNLNKPQYGAGQWDRDLNENFDIIDTAIQQVLDGQGGYYIGDEPPLNPRYGQVWVDTSDGYIDGEDVVGRYKIYNGDNWETVNIQSIEIDSKVSKKGDTMTGPLIIKGDQFETEFDGENMKIINKKTDNYGWSRRLGSFVDEDDKTIIGIGGYGKGKDLRYLYIGKAWNDTALKIDKDNIIDVDEDLKIKDLSVYDGIAGTISAKKDTGEVSTEHRSQVNVSFNSTASGPISQVNASNTSVASGIDSQVNAALISTASGGRSQVNASEVSTASGGRSQVNASEGSIASGSGSQVNSSMNSRVEGKNWADYGGNVIISGKSVKVDNSCGKGIVAGGGGTLNGEPSTQNRRWQIDGKGEIKASGSITGNSSFADFAEYMESSNGEQIPTGTIVALDKGQKIRVAREGDNPIGIISGTAGIILNAQGFEWKDRYLYDRYGQPIYVKKYMTYIKEDLIEEEMENEKGIEEEIEDEPKIVEYKLYSEGEEIPRVGDVVDGKEIVKAEEIETQQLNSDWDEKVEYIPREDREEWNVVGMKGQIYVNIDDTVEEHGYIKIGKDGIGTKGIIEVDYEGVKAHKLWQVMEITTPYAEELGYGIARVII